MRSVTDGKSMHSMHSYFLRPADIGAQVRYEVEILRDGRGYSTRQVRGYQNGKALYVCLANFAAGEPSGSFQAEFTSALLGPEDLPSSADYLAERSGGSMTEESKAYWSAGRSFDMRHVPGPVYLAVEGERVPHQAVWLKPFDPLRSVEGLTDAQRDLAALAYMCDYTILEPVLRVLDLPWAQPGLVTASLDHAMWFHRDGPGRRLAALHAGGRRRRLGPRPGFRPLLHPRWPSPRHRCPGGHDPRFLTRRPRKDSPWTPSLATTSPHRRCGRRSSSRRRS